MSTQEMVCLRHVHSFSRHAANTLRLHLMAQDELLQVDLQDKLFADARARNASMHLLASADLGQSADLPPSSAAPAMDPPASQGVAQDDS